MQDLQKDVSQMNPTGQFYSDGEVIIDKTQTGSSSRDSRDRFPKPERLLSQKLSRNFTRCHRQRTSSEPLNMDEGPVDGREGVSGGVSEGVGE